MCPCSQDDPQFTLGLLGAAAALGAYLLVRGCWQMQSRFLPILGALGVLLGAGAGVWFAAITAGSNGVCTAVNWDASTPAVASPAETTQPASAESETASAETDAQREAMESEAKLIAYYFHRTMRCDACLAIEAYTEEAIRQDFSDALEDGRLEWQPVNIEVAGNEHFEDDFQIATQSVVLAEMVNGEVIRWTKLEKVWDLLDDPLAFQEYVVEEVWVFLGG